MKFVWLTILFLFFTVISSTNSFAQKVSALIEQETAVVGDTVYYEIHVETNDSNKPSIKLPDFNPEWEFSAPVGDGSGIVENHVIINGRVSGSTTLTQRYKFTVSKAGNYTIPPATVSIGTKTLNTNEVKLTVTELPKAENIPAELENKVVPPKVEGSQALQAKLNNAVFILPVISNETPYNGEQIRVSYHLIIDLEALQAAGVIPQMHVDGIKLPELNQFLKEELFPFPQEPKFRERQIGTKMYVVAPIYEVALSSTKSGKLSIEPFETRMVFSTAQRNTPNDPFLNDRFFNRMSILSGGNLRLIARSPLVEINVKPLPTNNKPSDFTGAVGNFQLSAAIDKEQVKANEDTFSLQITLEGKGDSASLSPPVLPQMDNIIQLGTVKSETQNRKQGDDYISTKRFTYVLRATQPGVQEIPPVLMSVFDPYHEEYKTLRSDAIKINVEPGEELPQNTATPTIEADQTQTNSFKPIKIEQASLSSNKSNSGWNHYQRFGLFLVPVSIIMMGYAIRWSRKRRESLPTTKVQIRNVNLTKAYDSLSAKDYDQVFREISTNIKDLLTSKYEVQMNGLTIAQIESVLDSKNVKAEFKRQIISLLERCDEARYFPSGLTEENSRKILNDTDNLFRDMRQQ